MQINCVLSSVVYTSLWQIIPMIDRTSVIVDFIKLQQVFKVIDRFYVKDMNIILPIIIELLHLNKITIKILESINHLFLDELEAFFNEFLSMIRLLPDVCIIDCITACEVAQIDMDLLEANLSISCNEPILLLRYTKDPSIIGGMVLKIRDCLYDKSHKSYLDRLKFLCVDNIVGGD